MSICSETTQLKDTVLHLLASSGTADDQTNYGNDGSFQGGMGTAEGTQGLEYVFDGAGQYISVPDDISLDVSTALTVSFWFKKDDLITYGAFAGKYLSGSERSFIIRTDNSAGKLVWLEYDGATRPILTSDAAFVANVWTHVTVVKSGASVTFHVNGVAIGDDSTAMNATLAATTQPLQVGNYADGAGDQLAGSMKDIRIISRAITVTEIRELYNATARPTLDNEVLKLQPATGLVDQSAAGQANSTYVGDAGVVGRRFEFDGSGDYITLGDSIAFSGDRSVSFWCYLNSRPGMPLGGASGNYYPYISVSQIQIASTAGSSSWAKTVPTGEWVHIAITGDGTTATLYYNGVSQGTATDRSPTISTIAAYAAGTEEIDGSLDDIRIFSSALTAAEVLQLYEGRPGWEPSVAPRQLPGTVLHLEAATGERDQSYYGRNCTFNGTNIAADSSSDAFVFNGSDDYIDLGGAPLQGVDSFAVSLWLNPDSVSGNWIGKYSGFANPGTDVQMMIRNATQLFVKNVAGSISQANGAAITTGAWWHIVGVGDGTNITLYVNGVAGTPVALSGPYFPTTSDSWVVGNAHGTPTDGSIRDIRILNTALSADSVALLYNRGCANYRPPGLLGGEQLALMMSRHEVGVLPGTVLQLDGSTEYADQSGLGNDATNSGTTITDGKFVFDGVSDYISQDMPSHNGFASGTIAVWFKADASQVTNARLVSIGEDAANQVEFFIDAAKKLNAFAYISWAVQFNFVSDSTVNDDAWHHGVMTWESNSALMYVDGTLQAASDTSTAVSLTSAAGKLSIGEKFDISGKVFNGELDDIRIFNRALSAAEITTLYNNTIQDESANGNHGVMTNGAYVGEDDEIVLDGVDDYVDCGASTPAIGTGDLTISAWYYRETSDTNNRRLLATGGATGTQAGYAIMANQSQVRLRVSDGTNSVLDGPTLTLATWQHIAAVVDNTTNEAYVYLDGALETTIDISSLGSVANTTNLLIGYGHTPGTEWPGSIRDARIFNRALSAAEILALASEYEFQVPNTRGSVLGIVPSYFDTEADVTAIDWSGFGNAGVLTNGPTYTADVDEGGTRAIEFDGVNDRVEVAPHSIADALPWSVAMWIYRATGYESVEGLYGNGGAASRAFFYNNTVLYVFNEADTQSTTFAVSPAIDGWTHITLVCDGTAASNLSYYEDGVFGSTKTLAASDHVWTHFAAYSTSSDTIIGKMDDTYIFDRALSLDEIKALASTRNYFNCPVAEANLFGDAIKIWMGLTH